MNPHYLQKPTRAFVIFYQVVLARVGKCDYHNHHYNCKQFFDQNDRKEQEVVLISSLAYTSKAGIYLILSSKSKAVADGPF